MRSFVRVKIEISFFGALFLSFLPAWGSGKFQNGSSYWASNGKPGLMARAIPYKAERRVFYDSYRKSGDQYSHLRDQNYSSQEPLIWSDWGGKPAAPIPYDHSHTRNFWQKAFPIETYTIDPSRNGLESKIQDWHQCSELSAKLRIRQVSNWSSYWASNGKPGSIARAIPYKAERRVFYDSYRKSGDQYSHLRDQNYRSQEPLIWSDWGGCRCPNPLRS